MRKQLSTGVWIAVILVCVSVCNARNWKSADGKYSIDAELIRQSETTVTLKKSNGQIITVPLGVLSETDRDFLKAQQPDDAPAPAGDEESARKTLESAGLSINSVSLEHPDENTLSDGLKDALRSKSELNKAAQILGTIEQQIALARQQITQLTQLNVQLNARLATINPNDISANNKIVGALQANEGQMQLLEQGIAKGEEQERLARAAYNEAREKYVQKILDLRESADGVVPTY